MRQFHDWPDSYAGIRPTVSALPDPPDDDDIIEDAEDEDLEDEEEEDEDVEEED